jgi:hypothetical protein
MGTLLPGGDLGGVSRVIGTHYELVSGIFRALGANIGKNVYWPGSGLDFVGEGRGAGGGLAVCICRSLEVRSYMCHDPLHHMSTWWQQSAGSRVLLEGRVPDGVRPLPLPFLLLHRQRVPGFLRERVTDGVPCLWCSCPCRVRPADGGRRRGVRFAVGADGVRPARLAAHHPWRWRHARRQVRPRPSVRPRLRVARGMDVMIVEPV